MLFRRRKEFCWSSLGTVFEARFRAEPSFKVLISVVPEGTGSSQLSWGHLGNVSGAKAEMADGGLLTSIQIRPRIQTPVSTVVEAAFPGILASSIGPAQR